MRKKLIRTQGKVQLRHRIRQRGRSRLEFQSGHASLGGKMLMLLFGISSGFIIASAAQILVEPQTNPIEEFEDYPTAISEQTQPDTEIETAVTQNIANRR